MMSSRPNQELERWSRVDGDCFRYLTAGSGTPIVLLHGLMGFSFSWRHNLEALSPFGTLYALDVLGAGYSDHPGGLDCSLRAQAERLLRFLETHGMERVTLVGNSHGCAISMMASVLAAERGSPRVERLVMAGPVHPWSSYEPLQTLLLDSYWSRRLFAFLLMRSRWIQRTYLQRLYGQPRKIAVGTLEGYIGAMNQPGSIEYGLRVVDCWRKDMTYLSEHMDRIRNIPALIVWGTEDRAVPIRTAGALCAAFEVCEFLPMPGVGHLPMEEDPETFNRVVARFLQKKQRAAA